MNQLKNIINLLNSVYLNLKMNFKWNVINLITIVIITIIITIIIINNNKIIVIIIIIIILIIILMKSTKVQTLAQFD